MIFLKRIFFIAISFFILIAGNAQTVKSYEKEWKGIDDLIQKKNLPSSAIIEVKKLYNKAKAEGQDAQVIKALAYMVNLQQENREGADKEAILEIEKELVTQKEPAVSILNNLLAHLYWQYFQQHRWELYNRTATAGFLKADLATWSADDFHKKISDLFLQSLSKKTLLQTTNLTKYNAIVNKGNVRHLRPTLYDLLAQTALSYFRSSERTIKKPAYGFEVADVNAFSPAAEFAMLRLTTKDSSSLEYKALTIYQELIKLHLNDTKKDALIDIDIDRIKFVHSLGAMPDKDDLYVAALKKLYDTYGPAAAGAGYLLAVQYNEQASTYHPLKDTTHRFARRKAKDLLERIVRDSAIKGEGWVNSYNLLTEIKRPAFFFEVEKVSIPGQPFRALIKYKGIARLNFSLVHATEALKKAARVDQESWWLQLTAAPAVKSWKQDLPQTNDLQEHSVEIKIDALPAGEYILLASHKDGSPANALGAQAFHVSNISWVNSGNGFYVLHRETGLPLEAATVQVYNHVYDYKTSAYSKTKFAAYKTDKKGFFAMDAKDDKNNRGYLLEVIDGKDKLFLDDMLYTYRSNNEQPPGVTKTQPKIIFFTDRSIYRPGQTVFLKGIVVQKEGAHSTTLSGHKSTIYLRNANYLVTDSLQLISNEFGSITGKFTLPQNGLNGNYQLTDKNNRNAVSFSVEEYKRPKFYLDFDAIKETYKVGDSITIKGSAKAYAGNTIDGATVVYRVVRQPRFIYPWLTWRLWQPQAEPMEIAHGETVTDQSGAFAIRFRALADKKIDKTFDPLFDYRIYADVTDINGETRSNETLVSAGYKSLLLKVTVPQKTQTDSLRVTVRTENMAGEYQPAQVTIKVFRLIPEERLIRNRYWQQPDQFVMSKAEFLSFFPHDEYENENDMKTWTTASVALHISGNTAADGTFTLNNSKLQPGYYKLEISTTDKDGAEIRDILYTELFDPKSKTVTAPTYLWTLGSTPIEPGQKTSVQVGSGEKDIYLIHGVDKSRENNVADVVAEIVRLNNEKKSFEYSASEKDRGGYGVSYSFVKHNRFYNYTDVINVPWSNKELKIEYTTFRDKTLPGSDEKWTVKLSGYKGEAAAAEVLASMYDASLDQFQSHTWSKPTLWPTYARHSSWQSFQNFASVHSIERWNGGDGYRSFEKQYDELLWSDGSYGGVKGTVYRKGYNGAAEVSIRGLNSAQARATAPESAQSQESSADMPAAPVTDTIRAQKPVIDYNVSVRKNFNETAFFFPDLHTDKDGNISFSFTTPEALTGWKLQTIGHTKDLAFGLSSKEMVTQKELMVQPNAPRFLRQGDRLEFSAKVVNLSGKEMTGQAELQLMDAVTGQSVDGWFMNTFPNQYFTVGAGESEVVKFPIEVPFLFNSSLVWRVIVKSGNMSDGEEQMIPVLTNKVLVTETLALPMRGSGTKTFTLPNLLNAQSETLVNHSLTVEHTANPAWYVVQALPYLAQKENESAEQTWNRYYANTLAASILASAPRINAMLLRWKANDTTVLLSNLEKNKELKSALLEETPWVLQAKTEGEQRKNIALLFDVVRMNSELASAFQKLKTMQSASGGFVWFAGAPEDRYMTQYILTGIGHLKKLNALPAEQSAALNNMVQAGLLYLDRKLKQDYDHLIKTGVNLKNATADHYAVQYLYMRSFFAEHPVAPIFKTAHDFYRSAAAQNWTKGSKLMQGMTALMLHRKGDKMVPPAILKSLKETAVINDELGMYWKDAAFGYGWWWWQAPIETQSLMVEAFQEIGNDRTTVDNLRTWLLKNKQTTAWRTTKATADACYAMLLHGTDWLGTQPAVEIKLGSTVLKNTLQLTEEGTGYFKQSIEPRNIKPEMGNISVTVQQPASSSSGAAIETTTWGAVYWQYFEDMDKVLSAATPLQLDKKLFIEKNTNNGPVLLPVNEGDELHIGDKIKVRIELRADRDMEYLHMKDTRASALEPVNVLSGYKWQEGLGYYETTKDASTSFFFPYVRKGTYVFEYPLFVTHSGSFSAGLTTVQCLYAPEFSAHSKGIRINVQ